MEINMSISATKRPISREEYLSNERDSMTMKKLDKIEFSLG